MGNSRRLLCVACAGMALLLWLALSGAAQKPSISTRSFNRFVGFDDSGDHSAAISLGDVNGDGALDVVLSTGRHWESPIRLYLGDGKGGFKPAGEIGNQGYASYGDPLVDLNGDGFLDLAVGTDTGGAKPIFFGDGKGHFTLAGSFGQPNMPARNIAVGDLNGDGFPDIAIANRGAQSYVFLNDGKGGFARRQPFGGPRDSTVTVVIADVNGDGKPDLVIARRDGQQSVALINDGHANFSDPRPFGPADADTRAAAVGDLNGDGFPDIIACHLQLGTFVYFNDGHGHFRQGPRIAGDADGFFSLTIADMNRDGKRDIVGGNTGRPNAVFFNHGDGIAYDRVDFGEGSSGVATYGLAIADIDKDGYPDIAVARTGAVSGIFFSTPVGAPKTSTAVAPAPATPPGTASKAAPTEPAALFSIAIRPSPQRPVARRAEPGLLLISADLQGVLAEAYGVERFRVTGDVIAGGTRYDVAMQMGEADEKSAMAALQQAVCAAFHIAATRETRETATLVLKPPVAKTAAFIEHSGQDRGHMHVGPQGVVMQNMPLAEFIRLARGTFNEPIVDETGLRGKYDLTFQMGTANPETLPAELERQLGIPSAIERRPVEFLLVTKK